MGFPEVAVVIPTHDRAGLLPRALDSALAQQGCDFEVLVADDGSADDTARVLRPYLDDPRVRALALAHGGVSRARNAAVAEARAPLLAFLDSDDEWLPGKLEAQVRLLGETGRSICQTGEIWVRNGIRVNPPRHYVKREGDLFEYSLKYCMITPSSVLMTRNLFEASGGFNPEFPACEDYALWLHITCCHPVGLISKPLMVRYGGHADQLSTRYPAQDRFRIRAITLLLDANSLDPVRKSLALAALAEKLQVYRNGCRKRDRHDEVAWCQDLASRYLASFDTRKALPSPG